MRSLFAALAIVVAAHVGMLIHPAEALCCGLCRAHGGRYVGDGGCGGCCHNGTECRDAEYGRPDLFRNYYVPPTCGGTGAQMYLAPHPVPPHVGYTYFTYQPLMPHEFLYRHHRSYHRYYNEGRGLTRTHVHWW